MYDLSGAPRQEELDADGFYSRAPEQSDPQPARDPVGHPVENFIYAGQEQQPGRKRFYLVRLNEIVTSPPDWLIYKFLERESLALLFGDSGTGKSFMAIDMACCIATATPWHGHGVKQGSVVYIAGEGQRGIKRRFAAWGIRYGIDIESAPIFISTIPASFLDDQSIVEVEAAVDGIVAEHGNPALIVIDTLARNFGDGDENSTRDMGLFVDAADRIKTRYECAVLPVHHTGHANKERARGGYALKCSLDFECRLERDEDGTVRLITTKSKDDESPAPKAFRLRSVELPMQDEQGQPVTSAVFDEVPYAEPVTATAAPGQAGQGKNQVQALKTLEALYRQYQANIETSDDGRNPAEAKVMIKEWQEVCLKSMSKPRFSEAKKALLKNQSIRVEQTFVYLANDEQ